MHQSSKFESLHVAIKMKCKRTQAVQWLQCSGCSASSRVTVFCSYRPGPNHQNDLDFFKSE